MSDDDLLQKADALMRKHRVFVAGANDKVESRGDADNDDIPVLTEVVDAEQIPVSAASARTSVDLAELRSALAFEMEAWLDEELPQHVLRVLDGITDQLIIQLSLKARAELLPRLQNILEAPREPANPEPADD